MPSNFFGYEWRIKRGSLKALIKNEEGAAMIEFAMVAPILLFLLIGTVEISRAIQINRKFAMVTSMMSDQVAREQEFGTNSTERNAALLGITQAIEHILRPYDTSQLSFVILPIARESAAAGGNSYIYAGPYDYNGYGFPTGTCQDYDGTQGEGPNIDINKLVPENARVIVVKSKYVFDPLFTSVFSAPLSGLSDSRVFDSSVTWHSFSVHSPRHDCNQLNKGGGNACPLSKADCQANPDINPDFYTPPVP
ncbi:MAG: TadE/TadG family type IV pilus assembly protein [Hyphomicrobiaceae bacterium]